MQSLAVIVGLLAVGYGFHAAGLFGSLTGLVAAIGVGSGLSIALAERGTELSATTSMRRAQRIGGILAAVGCLVGTYHGGWRFGWSWGIGGYLFGVVAALLLAVVLKNQGGFKVRIPPQFDLEDPTHVALLDDIRLRYAAVLADESHPYGQCVYRPASILPYPKGVISKALLTLLDFVEGRCESTILKNSRNGQMANTIRVALEDLEDFLDVPAEQLPTDPVENALIGSRLTTNTFGRDPAQ